MKRTGIFLLALALLPAGAPAQEFRRAIEDNSFLIEEAFNQEDRVVQHISNLLFFPDSKDLLISFTQEWPVGSRTHQLSYTIPFLSSQAIAGGIGDILINYRYQLTQTDAGWGYVAPRISAILPTGSRSKGLGSGAVGVQMNLPVSKRWADSFITHFNAGFTSLIDAEGTDPGGAAVTKSLFSYGLGASGIYLMEENFNLLLELIFNRVASLENGKVENASIVILNPGFRFAIDLEGLQIVPGIAIPVQFGPDSTDPGIFGYLSFEHPF